MFVVAIIYRLARIKERKKKLMMFGWLSLYCFFCLRKKNAAAVTVINRQKTSRGYCIIYVCVCVCVCVLYCYYLFLVNDGLFFSVRSETRRKHTHTHTLKYNFFVGRRCVQQQSLQVFIPMDSTEIFSFFFVRRDFSGTPPHRRRAHTRLVVPALLLYTITH
jgi:hypothetical protein